MMLFVKLGTWSGLVGLEQANWRLYGNVRRCWLRKGLGIGLMAANALSIKFNKNLITFLKFSRWKENYDSKVHNESKSQFPQTITLTNLKLENESKNQQFPRTIILANLKLESEKIAHFVSASKRIWNRQKNHH